MSILIIIHTDLDIALQKLWYGEESSDGNYTFIFLPSGMLEKLKKAYIGKYLHTIVPYKKGNIVYIFINNLSQII